MSDFDSVGDFHRKFGLPATATVGGPCCERDTDGDGNCDKHRGTFARKKTVPHTVDDSTRDFRLKFLLEELREIAEGYGLELSWDLGPKIVSCPKCRDGWDCGECCNGSIAIEDAPQDLPKIADGLVDLVYVALGTAHLHGLNWPELFAEVQRANMTKERASGSHDKRSIRSHSLDVVKPEGFVPPRIVEVLMAAGWPGPRLPLEEGE